MQEVQILNPDELRDPELAQIVQTMSRLRYPAGEPKPMPAPKIDTPKEDISRFFQP